METTRRFRVLLALTLSDAFQGNGPRNAEFASSPSDRKIHSDGVRGNGLIFMVGIHLHSPSDRRMHIGGDRGNGSRCQR
ncbi:hypothetical protein Nepgr_008603 [Nepenthes gracilis]|uniref:Uncharacterized protein n=1 Tax=Nepenthes gracilis TaxID=150966 RepID=A0AAD3XJF1_NEPGR|nr:hypothetical protein Nepgr_008603 [Nepenthes gracilis]